MKCTKQNRLSFDTKGTGSCPGRLVEQMKSGTGITEELKAADQMKWVGLMNN